MMSSVSMTATAADPLIVTLQMDEDAFACFEDLRRRHFPKDRNRTPAHATLFHHLPGAREAEITDTIDRFAHDTTAPEIAVCEVRFTGNGVAFGLDSPALEAFRANLASTFQAWLTPQDRQPWRPHVTVQNAVETGHARALHGSLREDFAPFRFVAPGLLVWRYRGGPWEPRAALLFGGTR